MSAPPSHTPLVQAPWPLLFEQPEGPDGRPRAPQLPQGSPTPQPAASPLPLAAAPPSLPSLLRAILAQPRPLLGASTPPSGERGPSPSGVQQGEESSELSGREDRNAQPRGTEASVLTQEARTCDLAVTAHSGESQRQRKSDFLWVPRPTGISSLLCIDMTWVESHMDWVHLNCEVTTAHSAGLIQVG